MQGNSFQYKKQIRIQSGSAFSLSTNYIAAGSGRLMPLRINIGRNVPLAAHVEIIRPPLHHLHTRFQMLRFMYICRTHAVALLVAHLALDGVLRPQRRLVQGATGHCAEAMTTDFGFGVVTTRSALRSRVAKSILYLFIRNENSFKFYDLMIYCFCIGTIDPTIDLLFSE